MWGYRPTTEAEYAQEYSTDVMGERIPTYVVTCDGFEVTGHLTAEYIGRLFGIHIPDA